MKKPVITMHTVKSSQVESIGYDHESKTLAVQYKSGGLYHYQDVAPATHAGMMNAKSIGNFLHTHIKQKHKFAKQ